MAWEKKWRHHLTRSKSYVQNSAVITGIGFYEPFHDISSDSISNKTVSIARKLHWSTRPASQHTGGEGPNSIILSSSSARLAQ